MLVLSRKLNQKVLLPTVPASVQIVSIRAGVVRLGIEAPAGVVVLREELHSVPNGYSAPGANHVPPAAGQLREQLLRAGEVLALLRRQLPAGLSSNAAHTLRELTARLEALEERLAGAPAPLPVPEVGPRRRALLVEDNANERELLAHFLRGAGLDVSTAGDGTEALDYLRTRGRPDVVLLDMGLPRCDGATTVRQIRCDPLLNDLKIFAVTGHAPDEYNLRVGPGGVDRWFQKPIDPSELVRSMQRDLTPAGAR